MTERRCTRCTAGRQKCPRCGGSGFPTKKGTVLSLYEKDSSNCSQCMGCGTIYCQTCGGISELPPKALLVPR